MSSAPVNISVVTWDGGFRESFHTVDFFGQQDYPKDAYEFIWAEHGEISDELAAKIDAYPNARIVQTGDGGQWHAGRCINAGVQDSDGELIVVTDGDIAVRPDFLERVADAHRDRDDQAIYFRRWDEPEEAHTGDLSIDHLEESCELYNATNYGGGTSFRRSLFDRVGGYEHHWVFGGPGAVNMEFYVRLRNSGAAIIWHPEIRLFHPWHPGTLPRTDTPQQKKQKYVLKQRELDVVVESSVEDVERYLSSYTPDSGNGSLTNQDLPTRITNRLRHYINRVSQIVD
jgi:hypothetical protein